MDGVIYYENQLLPGVKKFVEWLYQENKKFLFLTNSSERSPKELQLKMNRLGLDIDESHFYTSALSTAAYLAKQKPGCTAYVIGEPGLMNALYSAGIAMNDVNPDYVVVGETNNYNFSSIRKAVILLQNGAQLIGTNSDLTGPGKDGVIMPACRALVAPIELATGKQAYYLGKPNPLMMRCGLNILGCDEEDIAIIGDRMDTDIVAGIESEIDTVLVLSGVTKKEDLERFPYRPQYVLKGVYEVMDH
ncbi:MAG: TIGR01457 family HAD-type hydrolase [Clostridiales bacterium]|nr:MAG: TIGR01457 family HAD-type hydrolase [Clostridiales bacterium]